MTKQEAIKEFVNREFAVSEDTSVTVTDEGLLSGELQDVDDSTMQVTYSIFDRLGNVYKDNIPGYKLEDEIVALVERLEKTGADNC